MGYVQQVSINLVDYIKLTQLIKSAVLVIVTDLYVFDAVFLVISINIALSHLTRFSFGS